MRKTEYEALKRKLQAELAECERKLEALEIVWSFAKEGDPQPQLPASLEAEEAPPRSSVEDEPDRNGTSSTIAKPATPTDRVYSSGRRPILPDVRELAQEIDGDITQSDITKKLIEKRPGAHVAASSVAGALRRMLDAGEIELVEEGRATNPNVYRRRKITRTDE